MLIMEQPEMQVKMTGCSYQPRPIRATAMLSFKTISNACRMQGKPVIGKEIGITRFRKQEETAKKI